MWQDANAPTLAAALAFYGLFSIAPLLIVVIAVAGLVYGAEAAQGLLVDQIEDWTGTGTAAIIQQIVAASRDQTSGWLALILSTLTLLLGSAALFGHLRDALNTLWRVRPPRGGIQGALRARLTSFSVVLLAGLLLLSLMLLTSILSSLTNFVTDLAPALEIGIFILDISISLVLITTLFALIFRILPDTTIAWRSAWAGGLVTAGLFILGKFLIGLYMGFTAPGSVYGAAGAVVALLLWIYYSAQIFYMGAAFTRVYDMRQAQQGSPAASLNYKDRPV